MGRSVLIVDDEVIAAELVRELIVEAGHQATVATDGQAALEAIERARPDVILVDVMMPALDRVGFLGTMRRNPSHAGIPVILMTDLPGVAPNAGGVVLQKPFSPDELLSAIEARGRFDPSRPVEVPEPPISRAEVCEIVRRFLPPGKIEAFVDGIVFVVTWQSGAAEPIVARSPVSYHEAIHRLVSACAPLFLGHRRRARAPRSPR